MPPGFYQHILGKDTLFAVNVLFLARLVGGLKIASPEKGSECIFVGFFVREILV